MRLGVVSSHSMPRAPTEWILVRLPRFLFSSSSPSRTQDKSTSIATIVHNMPPRCSKALLYLITAFLATVTAISDVIYGQQLLGPRSASQESTRPSTTAS
ncbi:hypothetical protein BU16DRAFT_314931 [Lophium mytilinum]|uniref:Uncharacterized protein n=1 Tax=Lophium mytilinum TaxID=390894 RepID=A0A6A6QYD0_9PEZI|nr:hypothetical protein BU16DRAFT_314931 [Lophium mytilinum]